MLYVIIGLVYLFVSLFFPIWLQVVLMIGNAFIPDPVPFLDEIAQGAILIASMKMRSD